MGLLLRALHAASDLQWRRCCVASHRIDRIERTMGTKKGREWTEFEFAGQSPSRKVLLCSFVDIESTLSTSLPRKLPNSSPECLALR